MTRPIYIVIGATGEYGDYATWVACAFSTPEQATEHAEKCEERIKEYSHNSHSQETLISLMKDLDPTPEKDYTGTRYHTEKIQLNE